MLGISGGQDYIIGRLTAVEDSVQRQEKDLSLSPFGAIWCQVDEDDAQRALAFIKQM